MKDRPYSIYINKRPVKIAFLISPDSPIELVDNIIGYNRELWGGRFNPIVLTDGKNLDDKDWEFLKEYDPDFIKSTVDLDEEMIRKISRILSPLNLELSNMSAGYNSVRIDEDPVSIVKNIDNLQRLEEWGREKKLVLFKPGINVDPLIRAFLFRNFGFFEHEYEYEQIKIPPEKIKIFEINNFEELNNALVELSDWRAYYQYQYLGQFCALPNTNRDINWDSHREYFGMVIGDTIQDLVCAWNRTLALPQWLRKRLNQLWVPTAFIGDPRIEKGIVSFINGYARQHGNDNQRGLNIISSSLTFEQLNTISNSPLITLNIQVPRKITKLEHPLYPPYDTRDLGLLFMPRGLELHTARTRTEQLQIEDPDVPHGTMGGEKWMADLYVEFENTNEHVISNSTKWWQLPQKNHLLHNIFNKPARINRSRTFSVLNSRKVGDMTPGEHHLIIRLPDAQDVIRSLITGDYRQIFSKDPRSNFAFRPYDDMMTSVPGQQLRGFIQIFEGIYSAAYYLQQRFWRLIFTALSNIDINKDQKQKEELTNLIKKQVENYNIDPFNKDPVIKRLASWFMNALRKKQQGQKGMTFDELFEYAITEQLLHDIRENSHEVVGNPDPQIGRSKFIAVLKAICNRPLVHKKEMVDHQRSIEDELKRSINDLLGNNILLAGIDARCQRCGIINWNQLGSIGKSSICSGCGYEFKFEAEPAWRYRLNALVVSALTQGITPLILTLAELERDARNTFLYIPSQELFERDSEKPVAEIDLFCIQDGKFIIGEIKESTELFEQRDFNKIIEAGKKLHPDIVVFSSMDTAPDQSTKIQIERVRAELMPLGIEVKWISFPKFYFEPSHMR